MTQVQTQQASNADGEAENGTAITSFCLEQEIVLDAPRPTVWNALTADIDRWWSKRLHHSVGPSTVTLDARVGGSVIESWDGDSAATGSSGGVLWGTINHLSEPEIIRFTGTLGMVDAPVHNVWTYALEDLGDKTGLKLTHQACGLIKPEWREGYAAGWAELLNVYLKRYIDDGAIWTDVLAEAKTP